MPTEDITIKMDYHINDSLQVGDVLLYSNVVEKLGMKHTRSYDGTTSDKAVMGRVLNISRNGRSGGYLTVRHNTLVDAPTASSDFLYFVKDSSANTTSLLGYYAEVEMINTSTEKVELYQIGVQAVESSK